MITTFMKKGSSGRTVTVVLLVLVMFFGYLHQFYTLDENNNNKVVRHIFSIFPMSAYQMFLMTASTQCRNSLKPIGFTGNDPDIKYTPGIAFGWLIGDSVLYFLLFCLFNLILPRGFGTPPFRFKELFSCSSWKRLFGKSSKSKISSESKTFIKVSKLSKDYKGNKVVHALKNVKFYVDVGEVIVIIGPNGAGKSTLIKALAGGIDIDEGHIRILNGEKNR